MRSSQNTWWSRSTGWAWRCSGGWASPARRSPAGVLAAAAYYPLATAVAGLATARIVRRHTHDESWHELAWFGDLRSESMEQLLSIQACVLACLAVVFTKGAIEPATVMTLVLASLDAGPGRARDRMAGDRIGGKHRLVGGVRRDGPGCRPALGWAADGLRATCGLGRRAVAAFSLLALAGWLRRDPAFSKSQSASGSCDSAVAIPLAWAMEAVALASSLVGVIAALAAGSSTPALGGWWDHGGSWRDPGAALLHDFARAALAGGVAGLSGAGRHALRVRRLPAGVPATDRIRRDRPHSSGLSRPGDRRGARATRAQDLCPARAILFAHCCRALP